MTHDLSQPLPELLYARVAGQERICARRLADALGVTESELAASIGLSAKAVHEQDDSPSTQQRLHELVEILDRVIPWAGSDRQAYAWYRSQRLPSYGNRTAAELMEEGLSDAVKTHLCRIAIGGYA